MGEPHSRVRLHLAADRADLQGKGQFADEIAGIVHGPGGERAVAVTAPRVGVGGRLDRPPVVAGREGDGVDAVHDALVVGGGPVGVHRREFVREHDAVAHPLAGEIGRLEQRGRDHGAGAHQGPVGQVGKDTQEHPAAADL